MKIGVLGGGQLGRMMALAGYPLGFRLRFLDKSPDAPAGQVAECVVAHFDDQEALKRFADSLDVVTYEFENVPARSAHFLAAMVPRFLPPPRALEIAQDRHTQKEFFHRLGIPTPAFAAVETRDQLRRALQVTGLPAVLKTRRWGYDGKGQMALRDAKDIDQAWKTMAGSPLILESFVPFEREVSLVAARSFKGETAFYPLTENRHKIGILRLSLAPACGLAPTVQQLAQNHVLKIFAELNYCGVLTVEFFHVAGRLLANEMATRVHNSGHWTIEGAETSQFENHLRAICGLPLGPAPSRGYAAMVNLIGAVPDLATMLTTPGAHVHLYGKHPRPGRKLGHVTLCAAEPIALTPSLERLQQLAGAL